MLLIAVAIASWALTGLVQRYASSRKVLDRPTVRSAHTVPTPRGGGLAVAATVFAGVTAAAMLQLIDGALALALVGGGGAVSVVGWLDDRRSLSPAPRLVVHFAAAVFAVALFDGLPRASVWGGADLGLAGSGLAVIALVWATNLYNFMDGLDGLAAVEAAQVGLVGALLSLAVGDESTAFASALVAAAAAGFLRWNWTPAKIFLGDVGSGLIGFLFGVLALGAERGGGLPIGIWIILLAVFGVDTAVTLVRRLFRGEAWYAAHRHHAYQRLARSGWGHARVVLAIAAVNLWLAALATLAVLRPPYLVGALAVAVASVVLAYVAVERRAAMPRMSGRER